MEEPTVKRRKVRISPMTRLTLSFDRELNLDSNKVFNREFYDNYIKRHGEAEQRLNQATTSLVVINSVTFLVLSGQDWVIPFFNVQVSKIPAIKEILLVYSSMAFFILCSMFATKQCYSAIIDQCGNRIVNSNLVDPDFYNAASKHFDFSLKLYRPKLNIWGLDFFEHGRGFSVFSLILTYIMIGVVLVIPVIQIAVVASASVHVYQADLNIYAKLLLIISAALVNVGGLAMVLGINKSFTFFEIENEPEQKCDDGVERPTALPNSAE